ncbi:hypothetical protein KSP39_PZI012259 [Platanthera zijinensis]|uniref:Tetratricopeptide repeat protein n=1 Tax=Platanthera zijinensis TaxID=2320716 RepID=A0AAP0G575_9ASPA
MQQGKYKASEAVYLKAQMIDADANRAYNLSLCLLRQGRLEDARRVLADVLTGRLQVQPDAKSLRRAAELLREIESPPPPPPQCWGESTAARKSAEEEVIERISVLLNEWAPLESIFDHCAAFEEISQRTDEIAF